jgi:hypothetical protein
MNRLGAGFSQQNTADLDPSGSFPRPLEAAGLDGSGVIVTVMDSSLDHNSTFFVDGRVPVENGTVNP